MDYKNIVDKLIEIENLIIIYKNNKYKFDDFIKEFQLENDPIELFENLIDLGYKFNSSHFAYYVNNAYIDRVQCF